MRSRKNFGKKTKQKGKGCSRFTARGQIRNTGVTRENQKRKGQRCRGGEGGGGSVEVGAGRKLTCTPSSWSQKSAAGGGAGRPQRGGGAAQS